MIVDQGLLDRVWYRWVSQHAQPNAFYLSRTYAKVSRRTPIAKSFEDWLWAEGAMIKRENKKCYLHFFDDNDATVFALRHG